VLILAKIIRSAAGRYAEYLEGKAQASELGDYYLKGGERCEAPGRWAAGAGRFGVDPDRRVSAEQLHALMDVRRPDDGSELRRAGGSGEAVAAIDATFSAPKSVSAAWALADHGLRERTERAHETAIDRALSYSVAQVPMLRRRVSQDRVVHERAVGLVATSWRHTTARAVDARAPDPQLHSHVLLHGAVRRDGRIVAIDSRSWLVHQREVGAAYRSELARELCALGFGVRRGTGRGGRYFELSAIPDALIDRWSSRHRQVQEAIRGRLADQQRQLEAVVARGGPKAAEAAVRLELLRASGRLTPAEERLMGTVTRSAKVPVTVADLDTEWRHTALGLGVSRERIEVLRRGPVAALEPAASDDLLDALTEFDAAFPARDARAIALECSAGVPIGAALEQLRALRAREQIVVLADGTGTTRDHRGRERAVVAIVSRLLAAGLEPLPAGVAAREAERLDRELAIVGGRLSHEQRAAITLGCEARQLIVIEGQAGTGKSTALVGIARAHQACGRAVIVTSTAALAAERLAGELSDRGVRCAAYSTAALHAACTRGATPLGPQTTIIHDEAALVATREQLHLLRDVESSGARLIAVGDPRQNQPVGAGGLWGRVEQHAREASAHVELTRNQRARDPQDCRDQARFRGNESELAIRGYDERDRVHLHDERRRAEDQALDAADADRAQGRTTIVIAQSSNEHLDQLNARAQAIRHQRGELGEDVLAVPGRPYGLRKEDLVQIRRTIPQPDGAQLRNGSSARIVRVDPQTQEIELRLDDGRLARLGGRQIAQADLRLAHVQHPFPAQGLTTDTAHLIIAPHATSEGTYVALTRAREQTHIYAEVVPDAEDQIERLAERTSRSEPELPSINTPLAHEAAVAERVEKDGMPGRLRQPAVVVVTDQAAASPRLRKDLSAPTELTPEISPVDEALSPSGENEVETGDARVRVWPRRPEPNPSTLERDIEELERDESLGWER
jgi:conjugative relaxase-like TrwC/TraI family protein